MHSSALNSALLVLIRSTARFTVLVFVRICYTEVLGVDCGSVLRNRYNSADMCSIDGCILNTPECTLDLEYTSSTPILQYVEDAEWFEFNRQGFGLHYKNHQLPNQLATIYG